MNDRVLVAHMIAYIEGHLEEPIGAEELSARSGYSLGRLRQKFFHITGDTPSGYLRKRRLTEAAKEILSGVRIAETALKYGYSSQENFTTAFRSYFGVTPAEIARIEDRYKSFIRRMREVYTIMELANLKQPPLCTTLMGCIRGTADYFDSDLSTPMLFGLSGHAFLLNIHGELCPSSPYVWGHARFYELLSGLGLESVTEYQVNREAPEADRRRIESELKEHLDQGRVAILDFLEHQLISGYDETGFHLLQPWGGHAGSEVPSLSYGSWVPCLGKEGWAHITILARKEPRKTVETAARDALNHALELHATPSAWECPGYRIGDAAYETWIGCVEKGMGTGHGHWWNGSVWSECRAQGSLFFRELGELDLKPGASALCARLAESYATVSAALGKALNKDLPAREQLELLRSARVTERASQVALRELAGLL